MRSERAERLAALEGELLRTVVLVEVGDFSKLAASEARCRELVTGFTAGQASLDADEAPVLASVRTLYARVGVVLESARRRAAQRAVAVRDERGALDAYRVRARPGFTGGALA